MITLCVKYTCDEVLNNKQISEIGGVSPEELIDLEMESLYLLDFKLDIPTPEFDQYWTRLKAFYLSN